MAFLLVNAAKCNESVPKTPFQPDSSATVEFRNGKKILIFTRVYEYRNIIQFTNLFLPNYDRTCS